MVSYAISARADQGGFEIEVVDHGAVRQTVHHFKTQEDVDAWIIRDARLNRATDPCFRLLWRYGPR